MLVSHGQHGVGTSVWHRLCVGFEQFFFAPADSRSLNLFRFLYCSALAGVHFPQLSRLESFYTSPFSVYFPIPLFDWLGLGLLPFAVVYPAGILLLVTLVSAAVGFYTRTTLTVSWIAFFFFYGTILGFEKPYPNVISLYTYHYNNIVLLVLLILSVAPGVALWGIDGWRRRGWVWRPLPEQTVWQVPIWPTRLIILALALSYLGAGFTKLRTSGVLWADGYTLQAYLLMKHLQEEAWLGYWLAQSYWACLGFSCCTLVLELSFIVVPFVKKPWIVWSYVAAGLGFHAMIHLTMRITHFLPFLGLTYLIFLDVPTVQWFASLLRRQAAGWQMPEEGTPETKRASWLGTHENTAWHLWFSRMFILGLVSLLLLCIAWDIERWPLSAYGVFRDRFHYRRVQVGQVRGVDEHHGVYWLKAQDLGSGFHGWYDGSNFIRFYIVHTGRAAENGQGEWSPDFLREGPSLLKEFQQRLPVALRERWPVLEFVVRSIRQEPDGRLAVSDQVLFSTAMVDGNEKH